MDLPETILELDPDTRVVRAQGTLVERNNQDLEQGVLDFIGTKELTEAEIREGVGGNTGKVGIALRSLVKQGRLSRAGCTAHRLQPAAQVRDVGRQCRRPI